MQTPHQGTRTQKSTDRTGEPGVESALGRDRTLDGDLPGDLGTNRGAGGAGISAGAIPTMAPGEQQAAGQGGSDAMGRAKVAASDAVDQAQDKAAAVAETVKQQVSHRLSGQIGQAADGLGTVSGAVRQVSQTLRDQQQGFLADYAERAAEQVERVQGFLRGKDLDQVVAATEQYARRQPMIFLGGAFSLGLLAARFLKSSGSAARQPEMPYRRPVLGMNTAPPPGITPEATRSTGGAGESGGGARRGERASTGGPGSTGSSPTAGIGSSGSSSGIPRRSPGSTMVDEAPVAGLLEADSPRRGPAL